MWKKDVRSHVQWLRSIGARPFNPTHSQFSQMTGLTGQLSLGHHLLLLRLEFYVAATITSIYPASEELGSGPQLLWQVL